MRRQSMQEYSGSRPAFNWDRAGFIQAFRDAASKKFPGGVIENSAAMHSWNCLQTSVPAIGMVEIYQHCDRIAVGERIICQVLMPLDD
jgi:hypothetical protein